MDAEIVTVDARARDAAGALLLLTLVTSAGIVLFVALLKIFRVPEVNQYLRRAYTFANRT